MLNKIVVSRKKCKESNNTIYMLLITGKIFHLSMPLCLRNFTMLIMNTIKAPTHHKCISYGQVSLDELILYWEHDAWIDEDSDVILE